MAAEQRDTSAQSQLALVERSLQEGSLKTVRQLLKGLHPAEIAHLIESLPPTRRNVLRELIDAEDYGEVLLHLGEEVRASLIEQTSPAALIAATENLDIDDLAELLRDLPDAVIRAALAGMDQEYRKRLEAVLACPDDTAGRLMNPDTVTVRADVTIEVVLRYLRMRGELPQFTDTLVVVDRYERYLGVLPLSTVVTHDPDQRVSEVMETDLPGIAALMPAREVAQLFENRDLISAPVIDQHGKLLGRITIDDVVDVIRDEAEQSVRSMGGLTVEEDIFAPILAATRSRAVWLGINLLTAFMAAAVIGRFEETLQKLVAAAVLMPIVASMGGIAGTQSSTLVVRGLALGQVTRSNVLFLLRKELAVSGINGLLWGLVVGAVAYLWFGNPGLALIIGSAHIINLLIAALVGVTIPILLRWLGIDPALASSVVLTTFTDVMGFLTFLGLTTLFLL